MGGVSPGRYSARRAFVTASRWRDEFEIDRRADRQLLRVGREFAGRGIAPEEIRAVTLLIPDDKPAPGRVDGEFPRRLAERRITLEQLQMAACRIDGEGDELVRLAAIGRIQKAP